MAELKAAEPKAERRQGDRAERTYVMWRTVADAVDRRDLAGIENACRDLRALEVAPPG
jgi:hypothetical protein